MNTYISTETNRAVVSIGGLALYFSYQTCVAFSGPVSQYQSYKRYSNTTSQHKSKMGCGRFETAPSEEEFERALEENFAHAGMARLTKKLDQ